MLVHDRVYGEQQIKETVLIELLRSQPLLRLKKINQAGASQYILPWKTVTRFEHSLGVMLLLKQFGASIHEQIAGLLHDVPHTAFSHVADFVFENEHHEYHEQFHESIIKNSEIMDILKQHSIPDAVIYPEHYGLLERPIPDLCADRIDYALRDFMAWKIDRESVTAKLKGLTVYEGEFVFRDLVSAEAFAADYLAQDTYAWSDPRELAIYVVLAQALQHALEKRIITHDDLFTDDETVYHLLKTNGDAYIQKKLEYLTPKFRIEPATKNHYHLYLKNKTRYVDPKIVVKKNVVKRLSQFSTRFKQLLEKHIEAGKHGWYVNVYKD